MVEALELIALIFLPVIAVVCLVMLNVGKGMRGWKRLKYAFTLHADKGLWQQGLFWVGVLTPFAYFLAVGGVIWHGYHIQIDKNGFDNFIQMSKFPITLLSLAIPFAVIVASFNTSNQTATQIEITRKKNNIDLFHSHRKEFFSYFNQIGKTDYFKILIFNNNIHPTLYLYFFKGTPANGTPTINIPRFEYIEGKIRDAKVNLNEVLKAEHGKDVVDVYIKNLCPLVWDIARLLRMTEIYKTFEERSHVFNCDDDNSYKSLGSTTEEIVTAIRCINDFFTNISEFAGYESSRNKQEKLADIRDFFYFMQSGEYKGSRYSTRVYEIMYYLKRQQAVV